MVSAMYSRPKTLPGVPRFVLSVCAGRVGTALLFVATNTSPAQHVVEMFRYLFAFPASRIHDRRTALALAFWRSPLPHSARSRSVSTPSRGVRSRTASSRSNSLGGEGDDERRPLFAGATANGSSLSLSHGSLSSTTAANTSSNMTSSTFAATTTGGPSSAGADGGGNGSGNGSGNAAANPGGGISSGNGSSGSIASGSGLSRFSKPTKAVSFAGDDDHPHSDGGDRNGHGDFSSSGRAALEDRSPDRSPARSPLRGSRLAALAQGPGFGGRGLGAAVSDNDEGSGGGDGGVHESDGYGWGFGERAGSITSSTQGVSGGEDVDEDEEGEMANFIVLDCSKVTNVSRSEEGQRERVATFGLVRPFIHLSENMLHVALVQRLFLSLA